MSQSVLLIVPQHDLPWPLGGWLRFQAGKPMRADAPIGEFSGMARWAAPNHLAIIATIDMTPKFGPLLHTSISHPRRDPFWDEIKAMREVFFPTDVDAMMMLPKAADYVNVHPHTFHVVQCPQAWDMR